MSCNQTTLSAITIQDGDFLAGGWASRAATDSRWLIVSDAPEEIPPISGTEILFKADIPTIASQTSFRFFLWHINAGSATVYVEAVIEVSDSAQAWSYSDLRREEPTTSITPAGMCIAAAHTFGPIGSAAQNGSVSAGDVLVVGSFSLAPGQFKGRCYELTVSVPAGKTLYVRTVASTAAGSHGNQGGAMLSPGPHIRGAWPYSSQEVVSVSINGLPQNGWPYRFNLGHAAGKDTELFKASEGINAIDNKGLYGVTTRYKIIYTANVARYIDMLIATQKSQDSPDPILNYFGAVERLAPPGNHKVPDIRWTVAPRPVVHTAVYVANNLYHSTATPIIFKSGVGGGAWLPVYLYIAFSPNPFPSEEPL